MRSTYYNILFHLLIAFIIAKGAIPSHLGYLYYDERHTTVTWHDNYTDIQFTPDNVLRSDNCLSIKFKKEKYLGEHNTVVSLVLKGNGYEVRELCKLYYDGEKFVSSEIGEGHFCLNINKCENGQIDFCSPYHATLDDAKIRLVTESDERKQIKILLSYSSFVHDPFYMNEKIQNYTYAKKVPVEKIHPLQIEVLYLLERDDNLPEFSEITVYHFPPVGYMRMYSEKNHTESNQVDFIAQTNRFGFKGIKFSKKNRGNTMEIKNFLYMNHALFVGYFMDHSIGKFRKSILSLPVFLDYFLITFRCTNNSFEFKFSMPVEAFAVGSRNADKPGYTDKWICLKIHEDNYPESCGFFGGYLDFEINNKKLTRKINKDLDLRFCVIDASTYIEERYWASTCNYIKFDGSSCKPQQYSDSWRLSQEVESEILGKPVDLTVPV